MLRSTRLTALAAAAAATLALAACSDGTTGVGSGGDTPLTAQQTEEIGTATADESGETVAALAVDDQSDPASVAAGDFAVAAIGTRAHPSLSSAAFSLFTPPACATISPNPPENPDSDRVPTDVTITFDPSVCTVTSQSGVTIKVFGTRHVSDPFPTVKGFDRDAQLTNLGVETDHGDTTLKVTRNGTRQVRGSASGISLTEDVTILRQLTGRGDVTVHKQGTASFAPDAGQTLVVGGPRPSGTITLTGTVTYQRDKTEVFTVQTVTPLHYDAGCADLGFRPERRIDAGELHFARTVNGTSAGYLKVVWSACGTRPTKTFVPNG